MFIWNIPWKSSHRVSTGLPVINRIPKAQGIMGAWTVSSLKHWSLHHTLLFFLCHFAFVLFQGSFQVFLLFFGSARNTGLCEKYRDLRKKFEEYLGRQPPSWNVKHAFSDNLLFKVVFTHFPPNNVKQWSHNVYGSYMRITFRCMRTSSVWTVHFILSYFLLYYIFFSQVAFILQ